MWELQNLILSDFSLLPDSITLSLILDGQWQPNDFSEQLFPVWRFFHPLSLRMSIYCQQPLSQRMC